MKAAQWLGCLLVGLAGSAAGAADAAEFNGQVRLRWDGPQAASQGPLAQAAQLSPGVAALPAEVVAVETELHGQWKALSAALALRQARPEGGAWHSQAFVSEGYASGEAAGWQFSAGRKIVAWDVGYGFRPNDVVQQEPRRSLLPPLLQGRALVQAEHFDAQTAWSLVWVNPQRAGTDAATAYGADEQAVALRVYERAGAADWHGVARLGQRTGGSVGAALSWVASDSAELHASARWAQRVDATGIDPLVQGLSPANPYRPVTLCDTTQALIGATWTGESHWSLMAEAWYDGTAPSDAQWEAWNARNRQLVQAWVPGGPVALRDGVAGNLAWQAQAFGGQNLRRGNLFVRIAWDHDGWQPALDALLTPADGGHVVTASWGWQGDRVRFDAGLRVYGGPADAVLAQLPVRRQGFAAGTWAF